MTECTRRSSRPSRSRRSSRFASVVESSSVNTREPQRDQHLRSPDFLDADRYPTIEFGSTRIVRTGSATLDVTGDLTIRDVTRDVTLRVETDGVELRDPCGNLRRGAQVTATLNRAEFGLTWNTMLETGGILVGDEIKVTMDVELVPAPVED
jgi:polyisoprenoid-binding protein YceI